MEDHGKAPLDRLAEVDLAYLPVDDPNCPVPLLNTFAFARRMAQVEGVDIGCRVATNATIEQLANLGLVMRHGGTPRGAFLRTAAALPRHCTHEIVTVSESGTGIVVCDGWQWDFDAETLHAVQLNVASIIRCVCQMTGLDGTLFKEIRMVPHPVAGLDHAVRHFGCPVLPAPDRRLQVSIPGRIADTPFLACHSDLPDALPTREDWLRLRQDGTLATSARIALTVMLRGGLPTVDHLAFSAGTSVRTLQRRLGEEGTSFAGLLDDVRHRIAIEALGSDGGDIASLASQLGFSHPAAFTRAVRRWTGQSPKALRGQQKKPQSAVGPILKGGKSVAN
ncbi:helix-turn-helix domain-containing protein [Chachezhania sediminis]|uniref:helix-turn-helix domain-containing protein n=1 Tax=Chachezhania sediminis TaxID=2599291 RepID=UPI00131CA6DC|nr:AraC family transcriptional regulator [Chachezhania sediminis]